MAINTIVTNCSGIVVQEAFERIVKNHLPNQAWLGERNFYKKKTRERMNSATPTSLKKLQNQEYIASSVIIHSTDGWNYLSRSIDSLLNGDTASSIPHYMPCYTIVKTIFRSRTKSYRELKR